MATATGPYQYQGIDMVRDDERMFERFTNRARHAVVLAQDEARLLSHNYIGTEHLLLGLLGEPEAIAGRVLHQLGIGLDATRADVEALIGRGAESPGGHIPFTPRAKKVLELSLREALQLGHNYIGTEHILLGLVREGEGVAAQVLTRRGAPLDRVRALVSAEVKTASGTAAPAAPRRTPGADAVIVAAEQLAGPGPVGSQHLLEAMMLVDDSLAASTLAALGVAPEVLAATIDELGTEGTADVSPEDAAARQVEVRLDDDVLTVVLRDEAAVQLGRSLTAAVGNPVRGDVPGGSPLIGLWQANLIALQQLLERVDPAGEPDQRSRAAAVRAAIRDRLRRRSG
jgi:ATP-dependent Clp protease ATP-binding subunit ClpA